MSVVLVHRYGIAQVRNQVLKAIDKHDPNNELIPGTPDVTYADRVSLEAIMVLFQITNSLIEIVERQEETINLLKQGFNRIGTYGDKL